VRLWFVTGTDTDVGKSVVTAALAASAPGSVAALKPVASGVEPGTAGEDAALLGRAAGHPPAMRVALALPVSPHRAAAEAGVVVDLDDLVAWVQGHVADEVWVEGVGGWAVPLSWTASVAELAEALAAPVLVVAADRLGVLNHTLLTVGAVRSRGLRVAGVVLNAAGPSRPQDADARRFNLADLRELLPGVPVAPCPHLSDLETATLAAAGRRLRADLGL
jgi:dethiobiotin synthetase